MLLGSILATHQALLSLIMIPEYWNPKRIFVIGIGPEDIIFCFVVGGFAWFEVAWFVNKKFELHFNKSLIIKRFIFHLSVIVPLIAILYPIGLKGMNAPLIASFVWGIIVLLYRRKLWPIAITGAIISTLIYSLALIFMRFVWPDFYSLWTWQNLWGISFLEIPLEEIVWGLLYGPFWAITIAYFLDAKPK
jgi:hypothetical protein